MAELLVQQVAAEVRLGAGMNLPTVKGLYGYGTFKRTDGKFIFTFASCQREVFVFDD